MRLNYNNRKKPDSSYVVFGIPCTQKASAKGSIRMHLPFLSAGEGTVRFSLSPSTVKALTFHGKPTDLSAASRYSMPKVTDMF